MLYIQSVFNSHRIFAYIDLVIDQSLITFIKCTNFLIIFHAHYKKSIMVKVIFVGLELGFNSTDVMVSLSLRW